MWVDYDDILRVNEGKLERSRGKVRKKQNFGIDYGCEEGASSQHILWKFAQLKGLLKLVYSELAELDYGNECE